MNRVKIVTHMSMAVSLLACLILALSGFLAFSDKTQGKTVCCIKSCLFKIRDGKGDAYICLLWILIARQYPEQLYVG